jgi:ABC-2 type transport system ATP-binding protein
MPPDSTAPAVALTDVRRSFGAVVAVDQLTIEVPRGTVTVLLGPNGAGKTTVVRLVTGALRADAGAVRTLGLDPDVASEGTEVRRHCGVVPARPALYDRLSGSDNLRYAAELFAVDDALIDTRIAEAAERFEIADALGQRVGGYSTGMRARLALARAVLHNPDLLLLDEPTAGLDPESARAVLGLIDEMADDGKTVVMCTHLLLEAEGLADQVVVMDHGHAVVSGSPAELTHRYWPAARVLLDADDPTVLDLARDLPYVTGYQRNGVALVDLADDGSVPELVDALVRGGARLRRVEPRAPSLEELYFAIRNEHREPERSL